MTTRTFCSGGGGGLGFDLLENGEIATQVRATGLSFYENVVSVWKEPGHGLVCEETEPGPSTELEKWEHRQKESSGDMTIDPVEKNLDPKTLRAVRTFIHGYPETLPEIRQRSCRKRKRPATAYKRLSWQPCLNGWMRSRTRTSNRTTMVPGR